MDLIMLAQGLSIGWMSPATKVLTSSHDTPLVTGPLTSDQISWIGSISCISGLVGSCTIGYIISFIGCKVLHTDSILYRYQLNRPHKWQFMMNVFNFFLRFLSVQRFWFRFQLLDFGCWFILERLTMKLWLPDF